ncbi:alpha/beta hydrolase [Microbacterium sp. Root61]|uniref:alpha/beta fold hydrolase n=1 Tax=Microbacterium sp. Root61 TaxID=1736570 RepID=UPI0007009B25|nr:alpha/beta hydrolase [Microbacterium sp. Root61]KRA24404.1 alpha/beta hydrolase [Microbacterium sp. Root61]
MSTPKLAPEGADVSVSAFPFAGATLIAEDYGTGSHTFLLIHGIGMGRSVFSDLATHLHHRGRIVAVDLPGYGDAPEPARTLTMERTADLVAAFIRSRRLENVVVVGHSMGTQVAIEIAARHPELVARAVLIAPTVNRRERTGTRQFFRLVQDLAVERPKVVAVGAREYVRAGPHIRNKYRAMLAHRPERVFGHVSAPVLILRGEHDYVSPRDWCRFVAESIPRATLAEIAAHGHETMIRDAAPAAQQIIAFTGV